ncbi:resolvase [Trichothermofontia sp.]
MAMVESTEAGGLLDIDAVQKLLHRSRASVYRYVNSDRKLLNPPYNPERLNPEYRQHKREPLLFHPNEVARFARDILDLKPVIIEVEPRTIDRTEELLSAILSELQSIHQLLKAKF